ncbi:LysR family transcriptional regulator [Undibacterium cyanobacteriorum]|uniref:LysR family transcriptional regulator n=1 Tax=Undibacterium cyanobacteriorum TaxID=3073561 RepID=A0ABY9RQR6_9BURK|nr:LysR family transcriptional regulator [Undibacterium sp. 20NA77.5]WMW82585.1 LysR family transcriptional regulator [Undibacterium sp. 20NA77.5]
MNLKQLNFHHLFYFWRVAKNGHLTRTADELHTSQSALSAQIKQLEDHLGQALFKRDGRRLSLTENGQIVFSYAETIFGLGQEMLGRLRGQSGATRHIRIGSVSTMSRNYQENKIRPLLSNPAISLSLESGHLHDLLDRLHEHQLDLVLANQTLPSNANRPLHCQFLGSQTVSIVGPAEIWKDKQLDVPKDLDELEMVLPGPNNAIRAQFDALCAASNVSPRLRAEVDDMAMLRLIARDSGWLAVVPEVVVQDELRLGSLVCVGRSPELVEHFYAITTPHPHRMELLSLIAQ